MPKSKNARNSPDIVFDDASSRSRDQLWLWLIVFGVFLRLVIAAISVGANDAAVWQRWGIEVHRNGLLNTYRNYPLFNHPPIPGYWAALCAKVTGNREVPPPKFVSSDGSPSAAVPAENDPWSRRAWAFAIVFKLAPILGDCLGIYLLYLIWLGKRDKSFALFVAAMFSLSLDAIMVSAYHCNTDSLLISLCLLSVYFLRGNTRPLLAGLALAAAINIKLIPVLLIPPLLLQMRSWRAAIRFTGGLAIGALPFVPVLLKVSASFFHNALQYNSIIDRWGLNYFFLIGQSTWDPAGHGERLTAAYYGKARYLILALVGLWALVARIKPRWSIEEVALVVFAIFLIFAPGFGVQYTVLIGLPLFAVRPRWGIAYALVAGAFVSAAYFVYLTDAFPFTSDWATLFPEPVARIGLATWIMLIALLLFVLVRPQSPPPVRGDL